MLEYQDSARGFQFETMSGSSGVGDCVDGPPPMYHIHEVAVLQVCVPVADTCVSI